MILISSIFGSVIRKILSVCKVRDDIKIINHHNVVQNPFTVRPVCVIVYDLFSNEQCERVNFGNCMTFPRSLHLQIGLAMSG